MAAEARSDARYVGLGGERYLVDQNWLRWPEKSPKGFVSDVAIDRHGVIYVLNRGNPVVQTFSNEGDFLSEWRSNVLTHGHALSVGEDGLVHIVDSDRHAVHTFDPAGNHVRTLGRADYPSWGKPFNHPTGIAVASNGNIYVSDGYGNSQVHCFAKDGVYLNTWGSPGMLSGQFSNPHSIAVAESGEVWVADRENNRLQRFDPNGNHISDIRGLYLPTALIARGDGAVLVTDQTPRLSIFDAEGLLIGRCRTFGAIGHGLAVDPHGDIYISDMMPNTISRFRRIRDGD